MNYSVDGWSNFCRVFEVPEQYPQGYCFDGGKPVSFLMIDWFNPVPDVHQAAVTKDVFRKEVGEIKTKKVSLDELQEQLIPWLLKKPYVKPDREYLVLFDFGAAIKFSIPEAEAPDRQEFEKHTCPYRKHTPGQQDISEADEWRVVGNDRVCSFCGSMHIDDFKALFEDKGARLELNTRRDKIYIHRKGVGNAGEGAIKIKILHWQGLSEEDLEILNAKLLHGRQALMADLGMSKR